MPRRGSHETHDWSQEAIGGAACHGQERRGDERRRDGLRGAGGDDVRGKDAPGVELGGDKVGGESVRFDRVDGAHPSSGRETCAEPGNYFQWMATAVVPSGQLGKMAQSGANGGQWCGFD